MVPDFELPDEEGRPRRLSELADGHPVVLFFYPAAMTYGCTKESCHFRDMAAEFEAVGRPPGRHQCRLGREAEAILGQAQLRLPAALGSGRCRRHHLRVRRRIHLLTPTKRATFVIGPDLRLIDVVRSEVRMNVHADRALEILRNSSSPRPDPGRNLPAVDRPPTFDLRAMGG